MAGSMRARKTKTKKSDHGPAVAMEQDLGPPVVEGEQPSKAAVDRIANRQAAEGRSNLTLETIRDFCIRARVKKTALDDARGVQQAANAEYRNELKEAKKAGIMPDDIVWWLANVNRDPAEIDAETKRRNRVAKAMGLPIGTQLGLWEDEDGTKTTVASAVDQAQLAGNGNGQQGGGFTEEVGFDAGKAGKPATANPHPKGDPSHDLWHSGWTRGQADNVAGLTQH